MSGHQLLNGKAFDPTMVGVIGRAFDCAWSEIESHFGETDAEFARARLAQAILIITSDQEPRDVAASIGEVGRQCTVSPPVAVSLRRWVCSSSRLSRMIL